MTVDDFAAFMTARYDEAEALAREAAKYHGRRWHAGTRIDPTEGSVDLFDDDGANVLAMYVLPGDAAYIADQDPAHRLADVKLKRAILAEHYPVDPVRRARRRAALNLVRHRPPARHRVRGARRLQAGMGAGG